MVSPLTDAGDALRRLLDGFANADIGAAAADIAGHRRVDI